MSIPAGAAGRGERNGWTGDAAFGSESECFDFGTGAFFSKYLEQVVDQQAPNGEVGGGVPNQGYSPTTLHPYVHEKQENTLRFLPTICSRTLMGYSGKGAKPKQPISDLLVR